MWVSWMTNPEMYYDSEWVSVWLVDHWDENPRTRERERIHFRCSRAWRERRRRTWHLANWSKNCSFNGERRSTRVESRLIVGDGRCVRWSFKRVFCKRSTVFRISSSWALAPMNTKEDSISRLLDSRRENEYVRCPRAVFVSFASVVFRSQRWSSKRVFCIRHTRSTKSSWSAGNDWKGKRCQWTVFPSTRPLLLSAWQQAIFCPDDASDCSLNYWSCFCSSCCPSRRTCLHWRDCANP